MTLIDIVQRLRFDAIRCEATFSRGVASNIEEGAAEIERLRAALGQIAAMGDEDNEWDAVDKFHNARSFAQRSAGQGASDKL